MENPWPFWSEKRFPASYENIYVRAFREDWFEITKAIAKELVSQQKVLDVGSGEGHTTKQILDRIPNPYVCDLLEPNPDALATSIPFLKTENTTGKTYCTTLKDFNPEAVYDAVFTSHTNYYWATDEADYQEQLEKFVNLCKPGGKALILSLPSDSDFYKLSSRPLFPKFVFSEYLDDFYSKKGYQVKKRRFTMRFFVQDIIENPHLLDAKTFYRFVENTLNVPSDDQAKEFVKRIKHNAKNGYLDFKDELVLVNAK